MAAILNLELRSKFYNPIGSRNGISIQNTCKKRYYTALYAIEGHFMNLVFSVAAILDYSKISAGIFGIFTDSDSGGFKGTFLKNSAFYIIF